MIKFYGILISLGALLAVFAAEKELSNDQKDFYWKAVFWILISGLVGARLYHVADNISYYSQNPILIFNLRTGGLGIWGGLVFGVLSLVYLCRKSEEPISFWLDLFAVHVPLAQSIGRWGNFFNKEVYGVKTTLPWGININGTYHHPLFLYESLFNLSLFIFLKLLYKKRTFSKGQFLYIYLIGYSAIRFLLDFLRTESFKLYGFNVSQTICIILFTVSVFGLTRIKNDIYSK